MYIVGKKNPSSHLSPSCVLVCMLAATPYKEPFCSLLPCCGPHNAGVYPIYQLGVSFFHRTLLWVLAMQVCIHTTSQGSVSFTGHCCGPYNTGVYPFYQSGFNFFHWALLWSLQRLHVQIRLVTFFRWTSAKNTPKGPLLYVICPE